MLQSRTFLHKELHATINIISTYNDIHYFKHFKYMNSFSPYNNPMSLRVTLIISFYRLGNQVTRLPKVTKLISATIPSINVPFITLVLMQ